MWIAAMIVLSILGYLFIGACYARYQAMACWRRARYEHEYRSGIAERMAFWPIVLAYDWALAPIHRHQVEIARLRQERDRWRSGEYTANDVEEKRLMVASYETQLRELQ